MKAPNRSPLRTTALLLLVGLTPGCGGPSQMGPDRDAFKTVDALYTAVSLREPVQVARCETTLAELNEADKLPDSAHRELASIIEEARDERWESAQGRLREFMMGQRP